MNASDLSYDIVSGLAYGGVGLILLLLGWAVIDILTPGKLGELICTKRNINATVLTAASLFAVGIVAATAIWSAHGDLGVGLTRAAGYGAAGLILIAVAFIVTDRLTPGKLGDIVTDDEFQPAVVLAATMHLVAGVIVAAAIS